MGYLLSAIKHHKKRQTGNRKMAGNGCFNKRKKTMENKTIAFNKLLKIKINCNKYEKNNSNPSLFCYNCAVVAAQKPRARYIGIPFDGTPGKFNAITDVKGVEVGTAPSFPERKKYKRQRSCAYRCYSHFTKRKK